MHRLYACDDFFFDLGTGSGTAVRVLYEPTLFAGDPSMVEVFDTVFGDVFHRRRRVCTYVFENDARYASRLTELEEKYRAREWNMLFLAKEASERRNATGDIVGEDFAKTFAMLTVHRTKSSRVVIKMDIEGREYLLLPWLFDSGLLCHEKVNTLLISWHDDGAESARQFQKLFERLLDTQECDSTDVLTLSDEVEYVDVSDAEFVNNDNELVSGTVSEGTLESGLNYSAWFTESRSAGAREKSE